MKSFSIEHIVWAYRLILRREPEHKHVLEAHFANYKTIEELSSAFITSIEGLLKWQKEKFSNLKAIFIHIPKTSGVSFFDLISKNYENDFLYYYASYHTNNNFGGRILSSHCRYEYFKCLQRSLFYFSIVRHPISVALSFYNFISIANDYAKKLGWPLNHAYIYPKSMRISLLNGPLAGDVLDNPQCRYLGATTFDQVLKIWNKENFLVGCFDYKQEFADICADLLHWTHKDFPHVNANPESNYQQRYLEEPGLVDLLTERNQEDIKLYEYVKSKIVVNTIKPDFDLTSLYPSSAAE